MPSDAQDDSVKPSGPIIAAFIGKNPNELAERSTTRSATPAEVAPFRSSGEEGAPEGSMSRPRKAALNLSK